MDLVPLSEIKWEYMKAMIDQVEAHGDGKLRYFYESKTTKVKNLASWLMGEIYSSKSIMLHLKTEGK